jgi:hypothetical protein
MSVHPSGDRFVCFWVYGTFLRFIWRDMSTHVLHIERIIDSKTFIQQVHAGSGSLGVAGPSPLSKVGRTYSFPFSLRVSPANSLFHRLIHVYLTGRAVDFACNCHLMQSDRDQMELVREIEDGTVRNLEGGHIAVFGQGLKCTKMVVLRSLYPNAYHRTHGHG